MPVCSRVIVLYLVPYPLSLLWPNGLGEPLMPVTLSALGAAVLGSLSWLWLDHSGTHDEKVDAQVRVATRYPLGTVLLFYGFGKVTPPVQFPSPEAHVLARDIPELGLRQRLWLSMGSSPLYTGFAAGSRPQPELCFSGDAPPSLAA
jgi:hypothetical protein